MATHLLHGKKLAVLEHAVVLVILDPRTLGQIKAAKGTRRAGDEDGATPKERLTGKPLVLECHVRTG